MTKRDSNKLSVLILAPHAPGTGLGGAERHLSDLKRVLESLGAVVEVLSWADGGVLPLWQRFISSRLPILRSPFHIRAMPDFPFFKAFDFIISIELMGIGLKHPAHIHAFFGSYAGFRRRAVRTAGIRSIVNAFLIRFSAQLETITQGKWGAIANSIGLREELLRANVPARHDVIPPPTDTVEFSPRSREEGRQRLGLRSQDKLLLFAGRWEYSKGADRIETLIGQLPAGWKMLLVSPSDASWPWPPARQCIRLLDVPRSDMRYVYQSCDALILPSRFEGYSLVVSEAQASGRPVLTSRVGHAEHLLNGSEEVAAGVVAQEDEAASWLAALHRVAGDDDKWHRSSRAARQFAVENVSFGVVARQWRNLLTSVRPELQWKFRDWR